MPLIEFLPLDDERVVGTVDAIQRELMQDGLVLRCETISACFPRNTTRRQNVSSAIFRKPSRTSRSLTPREF
jgi:GH15 family glucan-1,4-alpha-glucosidase